MSFNSRMHPRNIYRNPPDFQQLLEQYPEIAPHMTTDLSGKLKFDFKSSSALRQLTQVLLKKDFNLLVHIPEDHLVPTLPSRLNYLLWMQDLLACLKLPPDITVSGLDIGTGACAIYCLLGATFGWHMVGTDNSETSVQCACSNVARNNLQHLITVTPAGQHQLSVLDSVQCGIENGGVHFCMCNPPFYDESIAPHQRHCKTPNRPAASAAATGLPHELACSGGERHFVAQLVRHSVAYKQRCQIFSSLLGHKSSVRPLKRLMYECGASSVVSTEFCQGNTLRWGVAWTFCPNVDIQHVKTPGPQVKKRPPLQCIVPHNLGSLKYTVTAVKTLIISWLHELHMRVEEGGCNQYYASYKISATHDSWTHSRRRRRMMHNLASQLNCTDTPDESLLSSVNNQSSPNFPLSPSSVNDGLSVDSPPSSADGGSFTNSPSSSTSPLSSSAMCVEAEESWTSAVPGKKRPDIQDDSTCESEDSVKRSCRFSSPENNISSRLAPASPLVFTLFVQCRGGGDIVLQMRFLSGSLGLHGLNGVMCHVTNRLRSHVAAASGHVTSVKNT